MFMFFRKFRSKITFQSGIRSLWFTVQCCNRSSTALTICILYYRYDVCYLVVFFSVICTIFRNFLCFCTLSATGALAFSLLIINIIVLYGAETHARVLPHTNTHTHTYTYNVCLFIFSACLSVLPSEACSLTSIIIEIEKKNCYVTQTLGYRLQ